MTCTTLETLALRSCTLRIPYCRSSKVTVFCYPRKLSESGLRAGTWMTALLARSWIGQSRRFSRQGFYTISARSVPRTEFPPRRSSQAPSKPEEPASIDRSYAPASSSASMRSNCRISVFGYHTVHGLWNPRPQGTTLWRLSPRPPHMTARRKRSLPAWQPFLTPDPA